MPPFLCFRAIGDAGATQTRPMFSVTNAKRLLGLPYGSAAQQLEANFLLAGTRPVCALGCGLVVWSDGARGKCQSCAIPPRRLLCAYEWWHSLRQDSPQRERRAVRGCAGQRFRPERPQPALSSPLGVPRHRSPEGGGPWKRGLNEPPPPCASPFSPTKMPALCLGATQLPPT